MLCWGEPNRGLEGGGEPPDVGVASSTQAGRHPFPVTGRRLHRALRARRLRLDELPELRLRDGCVLRVSSKGGPS